MIERILLTVGTALLVAAQVNLPETEAGRLLSGWLEALNSGDRARMLSFAEKYQQERAAQIDNTVQFRRQTGGFELIQVEKSLPQSITALVRERANPDNIARMVLTSEGERVKGIRLELIPPPAGLGPKRVSEAESLSALEARLKDEEKKGLSGAILIARNGKIVLTKAWGLADREKKIPATLDTKFRLGSMNKMFTAIAVLQLVEKGKLALDTPIGHYLKEYPNQAVAQKVTVRHLLTHTGGTGDIFGPEFTKKRLQIRTLGDYVTLYGNRAPEFEPGSRFRYSNYGFLLLGLLIEAAGGQSYYDYVRENIFRPAGMKDTDSFPEDEHVPNRAIGYMGSPDSLRPNADTLPYRGTSAGGGYSTVGDLNRFVNALRSGKLLKSELLAEATKDQLDGYGFGFGVVSGQEQAKRWGHGGGAPGMNGELRVYPESGWVIVSLTNLDPPNATRLADYFSLRMPL